MDIDALIKEANALSKELSKPKQAFVPAQAPAVPAQQAAPAAPQGGQPQAAAQIDPASYPPELIALAQQAGLQLDASGIPLDPNTGQQIPPDVLAAAAQGGGAPPQGGQAPAAPQGGQPQQAQPAPQPPAQPQSAQIDTQQIMMALQQAATVIEQQQKDIDQLKQMVTGFIQTVSNIEGKYQAITDTLKSPSGM